MFAGCNLLCVAGTLKTTLSTFVIPKKDFLILIRTDLMIVFKRIRLDTDYSIHQTTENLSHIFFKIK